jgi:hypothetical protein
MLSHATSCPQIVYNFVAGRAPPREATPNISAEYRLLQTSGRGIPTETDSDHGDILHSDSYHNLAEYPASLGYQLVNFTP